MQVKTSILLKGMVSTRIEYPMMNNEEEQFNALLGELRLLESAYNDFTMRMNFLERALTEARSALDTIKALGTENPEEILIPVGAGVLLKGNPPNSDRILVNVGANVVLEKSRDNAAAILEKRIEEFEQNMIAVATQRNQIAQRVETDRRALQVIASRQVPPK
jgi:prefoldin alpha subunit